MAHIRGIGGVFLYARDPKALADWYHRHLGIEIIAYQEGSNYAHEFAWDEDAPIPRRNTTWAVLQATDEQADAVPRTVVNYHVDDLPGLLTDLREQGVEIEKSEDFDYGRFAWITDPEGHRIELYEAIV
jgi:catechol 2,3-dioxygenase-like lactoylglutathione lyase family enzyme